MTLVDVLAATAILAATVVTLAPLASDAHAGIDRARTGLQVRAALSTLPVPRTVAGEQAHSSLPPGCRLRWRSEPLPLAGDRADVPPARLVILQVIGGEGSGRVLAERVVPVLRVGP